MADIQYYWANKASRAKIAAAHTEDWGERYSHAIQVSIVNSDVYSPDSQCFITTPIVENMPVVLCSLDSVEAIFTYGLGKTAVLNFASYKNPGGGFMAGSRAQEECLCHESFLYNVLQDFTEYYEWNNEHKNSALYTNRAIYSPDIIFEHNGKVQKCDVITCAAPNITPSRKYGWGITDEQNSAALESRIKFILDIAASKKVDILILGAYGCGVFGQDATEVISLFKKYLSTTHKVFKQVIFAIPNDVHGENYEKAYNVLKED